MYANFLIRTPSIYQQALSAEKTPTLCGAVIAFEGFLNSLKELQTSLSNEGTDVGSIIDKGVKKLGEYYGLISEIPAYHFALSEWLSYL